MSSKRGKIAHKNKPVKQDAAKSALKKAHKCANKYKNAQLLEQLDSGAQELYTGLMKQSPVLSKIKTKAVPKVSVQDLSSAFTAAEL